MGVKCRQGRGSRERAKVGQRNLDTERRDWDWTRCSEQLPADNGNSASNWGERSGRPGHPGHRRGRGNRTARGIVARGKTTKFAHRQRDRSGTRSRQWVTSSGLNGLSHSLQGSRWFAANKDPARDDTSFRNWRIVLLSFLFLSLSVFVVPVSKKRHVRQCSGMCNFEWEA